MPGTFSVPARRCSCWDPPRRSGDGRSAGDFQETDTARPAELVGAPRDKRARTQTLRRQPSQPLGGIAEEGYLMARAQSLHLTPGLQDPGFIVGGHEHQQGRAFVFEPGLHPTDFDDASRVDGHEPQALTKEMTGAVDDGRVFDGANPHRCVDRGGRGGVMNHGVARLGGAAGPDQVRGCTVNEPRHLPRGVFERVAGPRAEPVLARGIAGQLLHGVEPCCPGLGKQGRRGVVVEVGHGDSPLGMNVAQVEFRRGRLPVQYGVVSALLCARRIE